MNTPSNEQEPQVAKPLATAPVEQIEVPEVLDFLRENGVAIVIGVVVAVAAFVGFTVWQNTKEAGIETASSLLANAQSAPQFQEIINNYGDTPAAPMAYLSLAGAYFDQGQYEMARQTFVEFQGKFADHDMAPTAELGIAQSLESLGNQAEALTAYDAFIAKHADHYMVPTAVFGKARVLEAMSRFADARAVYEDFIASYPESRWVSRAEAGIEFVKKQERLATSGQR